ncbi:MAG: hypothetical protein AVO39_04080 [delta proteobacterium MLS_D]|jgi:protein Xni|nr:MAG: hypothetical protein AVO39_04080 [delta proteobacterium MLS_D]
MNIHLLVVDGLNFIRRMYAAQPGEDGPERVAGTLSASLQSLARALRNADPTHAVAVFDGEGRGWRHELYSDYKAGRDPMPSHLADSLPAFRAAFSEEAGVGNILIERVEADDIIATLADGIAQRGGLVTILSTDKIFIQLLSDRITLRDHFSRRDIDSDTVKTKYGVEPERFVDLLALAGDPTNNIPGVPSVGRKTAARLIATIGPLDDILAVAHTIPGRTGEMISHHADAARLARRLVSLRTDLQLGVNLRSFRLEK